MRDSGFGLPQKADAGPDASAATDQPVGKSEMESAAASTFVAKAALAAPDAVVGRIAAVVPAPTGALVVEDADFALPFDEQLASRTTATQTTAGTRRRVVADSRSMPYPGCRDEHYEPNSSISAPPFSASVAHMRMLGDGSNITV